MKIDSASLYKTSNIIQKNPLSVACMVSFLKVNSHSIHPSLQIVVMQQSILVEVSTCQIILAVFLFLFPGSLSMPYAMSGAAAAHSVKNSSTLFQVTVSLENSPCHFHFSLSDVNGIPKRENLLLYIPLHGRVVLESLNEHNLIPIILCCNLQPLV